jgi:hypothetical protein
MKNLLISFVLVCTVTLSNICYSQAVDYPDYKHFFALNLAPSIGQISSNASSGNTLGFAYKYKMNEHFKLRFMGQFEERHHDYRASYFLFTDTLITFLNKGRDIQNWRLSAGFEKGKYGDAYYLYWGIQAAFGVKESAYNNSVSGFLSASDYTSIPLLPGSGHGIYDVAFSEQNDTISFVTNLKQNRFAVGVPMGIGVKILKHVELQVEVTPEAAFTRSRYDYEHFLSKEKSEMITHAFDFDIRQFQILLGWKF